MNASFRKWIKPGTNQSRIYVNNIGASDLKVYVVANNTNALGFEIVVFPTFGGHVSADRRDAIMDRVEDAAREALGTDRNMTFADYAALAA